jgi:hypothetical protein
MPGPARAQVDRHAEVSASDCQCPWLAVSSGTQRAHGKSGRSAWELDRSWQMKLLSSRVWCPAVAVVDRSWPWLIARRRLCPAAAGICVTAHAMQGMAPYPGHARCLALGFWPECFRRLNVNGGRRSFPEETRSALDIEGKHVTIQGPSPNLSPAAALAPSVCTRAPVLPGEPY